MVYVYADCNSSKRPLIGFCHATKAVKAHLTSAEGRFENLRGTISNPGLLKKKCFAPMTDKILGANNNKRSFEEEVFASMANKMGRGTITPLDSCFPRPCLLSGGQIYFIFNPMNKTMCRSLKLA